MHFRTMFVKASVVLALHVLLLTCFAENIAAHTIDSGRINNSSISPDTGSENITSGNVYNDTTTLTYPIAVEPRRAELSPETTESQDDGDSNVTELLTVPVGDDSESSTVIPGLYDAQINVSATEGGESEVPTESPKSQVWVQKIAKKSRSRSLVTPSAKSAPPAERVQHLAPLGQVIASILYGAPWSTNQTSSKCAEDMRVYNQHVKNYTLWAAKMLDATSKGPEGQFDGNTFSFGSFDQCINAKSKIHGIRGGYTLVDINFRPKFQVYPEYFNGDHLKDYDPHDEDESAWEAIKDNIQKDYIQRHKFQWAVCLPENCHYEDVQKIVSNALIPELNRHGMDGDVTVDPLLHTSSLNTSKYNTGFIIACILIAFAVLLLITGSLYDYIYLKYRPKSEHGPMKNIMKPFSVISNMERLLKPSNSEEFSIMNGIKVITIVQVILGHRFLLELGNPQANPDFINSLVHSILFGHFTCTIFLETFFVFSGFLTFHFITKLLTERKKLNFLQILTYRWLRIFPVYGTLIGLYIFVLPYLNDGPYWKRIIYRESDRCRLNWWANVLFINNYVDTDDICIIPSWYLACDMHFFIVGTFVTYVIWKWRKLGLIILGAFLTLSTILPAYIIVKDHLRGLVEINPHALTDLSKETFYTTVYVKSHMRSMTYFIGMCCGYLYMKLKEADYKLSLKSRIIWMPIVFLSIHIVYWSSSLFYIKGYEYNAYEHAIYFTVGRFLWSVFMSYVIIAHGLGGLGPFISGLFGNRFSQILGKLVFCVYMYQEIVQLQTIASIRTPTYQNFSLIAWRFCGDTLAAFFYALVINLTIESPCDRLQKNLMKIFVGDLFSKKSPPQVSTEITLESIENKSTQMTA